MSPSIWRAACWRTRWTAATAPAPSACWSNSRRFRRAKSYSYLLAGPDGIALRTGLMAVAEYGEGRVHLFDRDGGHLHTLKVPMPFVDTVAWDGAGNLYAGGAFQNTRSPYEGAVVRFAPAQWQKPAAVSLSGSRRLSG